MLLATCGELVWLAPLVFAAGVGTWHKPPQGPTMPANPRSMRERAARNVFAAASVHGSYRTLVSPAWQVSKVMRRTGVGEAIVVTLAVNRDGERWVRVVLTFVTTLR